MTYLQYAGLPHSDICGSMFICNSPQLFAAYHVLLRLREPRHPPCALIYFLPTNTYARVSLIYTLYRFTTYFIENMSKILILSVFELSTIRLLFSRRILVFLTSGVLGGE